MRGPSGIVIGTAGHIDHGKTSLVRALTGIDTDRLADEKKRGISIDLGFAHLTLPGGKEVSFVDVPGHERFIKNMLAGAGGIQAVLLIVAADESVKPQTREHLAICRLLGLCHGIVVLTKTDIATREQIEAARYDVHRLCGATFLEAAPLVEISAVTGAGLDTLRNELSNLVDRVTPRNDAGLARLPIDRSFALKGFGTVVTGTLWSGTLRPGDTVVIFPLHREARVRGVQVHGKSVERAIAGQRTAVNLAGIDSSEIRRGFVLTQRAGLQGSTTMDVSLEWLEAFEIPKTRRQFLFHTGTAEIPAVVKMLGVGGSAPFARVWFAEPLLALPGDRFVLRRPSPAGTVAGGAILDAFPPLRLNRMKTTARLHLLSQFDIGKRLHMLVEEGTNGRRLPDLVRLTGAAPEDLKAAILKTSGLIWLEAAQRVVTNDWMERMRGNVLDWLAAFHAQNPSAAGAPIAQARLNLEPSLAAAVFEGLPGVRVERDLISLAAHKAQFSSEDSRHLLNMGRAFRQAGLQPPPAAEVMKCAGADSKNARRLLETLVKNQELVRVSQDLIFHAEALLQVRKTLSAHRGRKFSVPEFKEWTGISRKYAIPLLEYLDRQHVTRREGDARVVL